MAAHFLTCFLSAVPPRYVAPKSGLGGSALAPPTPSAWATKVRRTKVRRTKKSKVEKRVRLFLLPKPYLLPRPRWAGRPPVVVVEVVGRGEAPRWHSLCLRGPAVAVRLGSPPGVRPFLPVYPHSIDVRRNFLTPLQSPPPPTFARRSFAGEWGLIIVEENVIAWIQ